MINGNFTLSPPFELPVLIERYAGRVRFDNSSCLSRSDCGNEASIESKAESKYRFAGLPEILGMRSRRMIGSGRRRARRRGSNAAWINEVFPAPEGENNNTMRLLMRRLYKAAVSFTRP